MLSLCILSGNTLFHVVSHYFYDYDYRESTAHAKNSPLNKKQVCRCSCKVEGCKFRV